MLKMCQFFSDGSRLFMRPTVLPFSVFKITYSYGHGISSIILLSIRKNLCSLSFIVIVPDIQNFYERNSVMHNKNQNATSNVFD
jgi:hypothetical protein